MDKEGDLCFLSAAELSRLIQRREVSPVEATEAYLDRIEDLDFKFNSYLTVCRKEALQDARKAEEAIAQGNYLGPMHGIPFAVKDQLWSKGVRTTGGSRILADFVPDEDATPIANLKKAGAVLLGKTNLFEFAIYPAHRYSEPRNPWNLDMTPGGSSGGSGGATAAFLCATSLGEDTGGSLRLPAAWCGLVGLLPSWGRVSRYGLMTGGLVLGRCGAHFTHGRGRRYHPAGYSRLRPQRPLYLEHSRTRLRGGAQGRRQRHPGGRAKGADGEPVRATGGSGCCRRGNVGAPLSGCIGGRGFRSP